MKKNCLRPKWFSVVKFLLKIIIKKPEYIYLGNQVENGSIILSNHVGAFGPLKNELYFDRPFRFWGTYEMNSNIVEVYKYLSNIYFPEKKHWNIFLSKMFCIIAAPVLWVFYRGINLISTYPDYRLKNTIKTSIETIENGTSLIIFPEDSTTGYHDEISKFYAGFALLCQKCYQKGLDLNIHVAYLKKKENKYIIDKSVKYSELLNTGLNKEEIANILCQRVNQLSKISC